MTRSQARLLALTVISVVFASVGMLRGQDTPRAVNPDARALVHQIAILRSGQKLGTGDLLPLPEFVHTAPPRYKSLATWLDFSAIYIIPPQMTVQPMEFNVSFSTGLGPSMVTAWYPHAASPARGGTARIWNNVQVGTGAEGLQTTHPTWLTARGMEAAATVRVQKHDTSPDDNGTTEGDVFLFMRGQVVTVPYPLQARYEADTKSWLLTAETIGSTKQYPVTSSTQQMWLARTGTNNEILSRRITVEPLELSGAGVRISGPTDLTAIWHDVNELRTQLNEAIVGHGLRPDEASAHSKLLLDSIAKADSEVLVYILSPQWIDKHFPLQVDGPAKKPVRVFIGLLELPAE